MQPKRDGWASIGDVFSGLIGPVKQALVRYCQVKWNSLVLEAKSVVGRT